MKTVVVVAAETIVAVVVVAAEIIVAVVVVAEIIVAAVVESFKRKDISKTN
jgi:hypothetical protein